MNQPEGNGRTAAPNAPLLRVIPLGGLGEIGKNMMVLESGDNLLVIDAGLMFPSSEMHGIDLVIPDATYVLERLEMLRGVILTHGHEDHIGAVAFLIEEGLRAPIYATAITRGLLEVKLREQKVLDMANLVTVTEHDILDIAPFNVEFFHTCHSFPDSFGVSVMTPAGRVVHTSDYRFDETPVDGKPTEADKLQRWGDEGVLLLVADSTNIAREGHTPSESSLEPMLERVFANAKGRVLFSTFASNLGRVRQIMNVAQRFGRRVGVVGRSMVSNVKIATQLGYLEINQDDLITAHDIENLPPSHVVVIATGSQGEPTSAMVRMSVGDHRQITLRSGDTVVLSAVPIPGNEELFNRTVDNLFRQGADVIYHELGDVHVSGHGGRDDYRRMLDLVRPRHFIPAHGEYRHLVLHGRLGVEAGLPKENVFIIEDGQVIEFGHFDGNPQVVARWGEKLPVGNVYVDGLGVGDVGNVVLRDRRHLSEDGFLVCVVALDEFDGAVIYGPEIITRGFVYVRDNEEIIKGAQAIVQELLKKKVGARVLENKIKDALTNFANKEIGRRPMILPLVMEV